MQLFYVFAYNRKHNVRLHIYWYSGIIIIVGSTHMDKQIIYDPIYYELTGPWLYKVYDYTICCVVETVTHNQA